jgi:hypothetical protein
MFVSLFVPRFSIKRGVLSIQVQPRKRKMMNKIGIGIPSNQSKMYPVAPASFTLFTKRILGILYWCYCFANLVCSAQNFHRAMKRTIGLLSDYLVRQSRIRDGIVLGL